MSVEKSSGGGVDPQNLWGKPIPHARVSAKPAVRAPARHDYEETVMDDEDQIDVDAELEDAAEPDESELQEVEGEYVSVDNLYYDGDSVKESSEAPETDETGEYLESAADDEEPDYDDDEPDDSENSDDSENDESDDGEVEDSYGDDDAVETQTAARKTQQKTSLLRGNEMPEGKKVTLSDHVRREINKRKESGASVRGCDIVAALDKRGITVSQAQVSQLLKKAGLTSGRPGRPSGAVGTGPGRPGRPGRPSRQPEPAAMTESDGPTRAASATRKPNSGGTAQAKPQPRASLTTKTQPKVSGGVSGFHIPMAQLKAAEAFVTACDGSFEKATQILTVAEQLSQTFAG